MTSATQATRNVTPGDNRQKPNRHTRVVIVIARPDSQVRVDSRLAECGRDVFGSISYGRSMISPKQA
jgi:hypothetical protein